MNMCIHVCVCSWVEREIKINKMYLSIQSRKIYAHIHVYSIRRFVCTYICYTNMCVFVNAFMKK